MFDYMAIIPITLFNLALTPLVYACFISVMNADTIERHGAPLTEKGRRLDHIAGWGFPIAASFCWTLGTGYLLGWIIYFICLYFSKGTRLMWRLPPAVSTGWASSETG